MSRSPYLYGRAHDRDCDSWLRRRFIHEHVISQRAVEFALPTNNRAVYYVGKGTAWPDDKAKLAMVNPNTGKPYKRKPSQYVSDDINWLIDNGLVDQAEIEDVTGMIDNMIGVVDLLAAVSDYAQEVITDPWSPRPVPVLLGEGDNDQSLLAPIGRDRRCWWATTGGMRGREHIRRLARKIDPAAPIGYVGDWNRSGFDIERNAKQYLRTCGWHGTWKRLLLDDTQVIDMTQKVSVDGRDGQAGRSVETAEMPVPEARRIIHGWLDEQLPDEPDADESRRDEIVASLEALEVD